MLSSGFKSSEFWATLITSLLVILAPLIFKVNLSEEAQVALSGSVAEAVAHVLGAITAVAAVWKYISGRVELKKEVLYNEATRFETKE